MRRCATILALLSTSLSFGWGGLGHQLVNDLAWTDLSTKSKVAVAKILLAGDPTYRPAAPDGPLDESYLEKKVRPMFAMAALWPDDIKNPAKFTSPLFDSWVKRFNRESPGVRPNLGKEEVLMKTWHYYDVPLFDATGRKQARPSNAVRGLSIALPAFRAGNAETRAFWLYWITHIVGDLHQPLHCCESFKHHPEEGDEGGNLFNIYLNSSRSQNARRNLHSLWDGGVQDAVRLDQRFPANADLEVISSAWKSDPYGPSEAEISRQDPLDWANEGASIAKTRVYADIEPESVLSDSYRVRLAATCKGQARLAGARLARLLNNILDPS